MHAANAEAPGTPGDTSLAFGMSHTRARNGSAGKPETHGSWESDRAASTLLFDNDGNDHFMPLISDSGSLLDPKVVASRNHRGSGKRTWLGLHHSKTKYSKWVLGIVVVVGMLGLLWQAKQQPTSKPPRSHVSILVSEVSSAASRPQSSSYLAKPSALQRRELGGRGRGVHIYEKPGASDSKFQCLAKNGTRPVAAEAEVKAARNTYGYQRQQREYSSEQYPKVVNGDGFRFIMCTIPKNGCSQWKRLILKAMGKPESLYLDRATSHLTVHGKNYSYLPMIPEADMMDALTDPDTPRLIISRNPFTRVLSSYLNKIVKANDRLRYREELGLDLWSDWVTFEEYINALEKWAAEKPSGLRLDSGVDHHFALQSSFCGMPNDRQSNLHYDYILKTEEINDWYTCIVKELNISSLVYSGWPDDKCFFSAPDNPCDGQTMKGGFSSNKWDAGDHGTKSSLKLRGYYSPELEATVARLYADDFEIFGYHNRLNQSTVSDLGYNWQEAPKLEEGTAKAE